MDWYGETGKVSWKQRKEVEEEPSTEEGPLAHQICGLCNWL